MVNDRLPHRLALIKATQSRNFPVVHVLTERGNVVAMADLDKDKDDMTEADTTLDFDSREGVARIGNAI
jgi:hypothetical protein